MKTTYRLWLPLICAWGLSSSVSTLFLSEASAELKECNGVWINGDCEGGVSRTLSDHVPAAPEDPALSQKRSLIHELRMKNIRAREQYEIRFDIADVERFCLKSLSSADGCRDKIEGVEKDLDVRIARESKIQTEAKRLKLEEEREKIAKTEREANATSVTIVQNVIRVPRSYQPGPPRQGYTIGPDGFTRPIVKPDPRYNSNNSNWPGAGGPIITGPGSFNGSGSGVSIGLGGYRREGRNRRSSSEVPQ